MSRPFTPWPGGNRPPVAADHKVELRLRCGRETPPHRAGNFIWANRGQPGDIVGFREPEKD